MSAADTEADSAQARPHLGKRLYVIFSEPTSTADERRAVHAAHLAHQYDFEARGILFAAGPFLGDDGRPSGPGMIIVRAAGDAEARAIADGDPYHSGGFRSYRIERWMLNEGTLGLRVNYSNGTVSVD